MVEWFWNFFCNEIQMYRLRDLHLLGNFYSIKALKEFVIIIFFIMNIPFLRFDIFILQSVLGGTRSMGTEMAHQLYCLQTLLLNTHETKMNAPVDPNDPVSVGIYMI